MPDTITITDDTGATETMEVFTLRTEAELLAYLAKGTAEVVDAPGIGEAYIDRLHRRADGMLMADVLAATGEGRGQRDVATVSVDTIDFIELSPERP